MSTIIFIFKVILCELFIVCVGFAFLGIIEITFYRQQTFSQMPFLNDNFCFVRSSYHAYRMDI